jgi:hypothetical protein
MLHKLTTCTVALMFVVGLAGLAQAADTTEVEQNDSLATAMDIDDFFSLGSDSMIINSDTVPWVSITSTADNSFDYYGFTVSQNNSRGWFDIDRGSEQPGQIPEAGSFNAILTLFDLGGNELAENDDAIDPTDGSEDSLNLDPFLDYTFDLAGTYFIRVGVRNLFGDPTALSSADTYELQVSIQNHGDDNGGTVVPAPAALFAGGGLIGLIGLRRRR